MESKIILKMSIQSQNVILIVTFSNQTTGRGRV